MMTCDDESVPNEQEGTGWPGEGWVVKMPLCGHEGAEKTGEHQVAWNSAET